VRGTRVVEQDASLGIAHQHRLWQLGHQRGQAPALLLEALAGRGDARQHVGA
jgi:hypothetical protein